MQVLFLLGNHSYRSESAIHAPFFEPDFHYDQRIFELKVGELVKFDFATLWILKCFFLPNFHRLSPHFHRYTGSQNVWVDRPFYWVKRPQEKWACDFHDNATPLSFQVQVTYEILPFNFDLKFCWNWSFFHYEKIMRFKKSPQLPGAGRTRAWHHHGSHTPTSPGAILLGKMAYHTKQIRRQCTTIY